MFSSYNSSNAPKWITTCIWLAIASVLTLIGPIAEASAQGKLSRVRESVRASEPAKDHSDQDDSHDDDSHDDDSHDDHDDRHQSRSHRSGRDSHRGHNHGSSGGGGSILSLFLSPPRIVEHVHRVAPVRAPVYVVEDYSQQSESYPSVPVIETVVATNDVPQVFDDQLNTEWAARMTAFAGSDFDDISLGSFGLLFQSPGSLGLDASATMLRETGMSFRDHLWIGDVNLVFEGTTGDLRSRIGMGVNWLGDQYGGEAGFNLTAGFDLQLTRRLILTGEADFGTLGDSDFLHGQISIGRQIEHAELMVGYNYHDIGGTTIGSAFTGLRFRF